MDKATKTAAGNGWKPPANSFDMQMELFRRHGRDFYTEQLDRKWRRLGKMIESGARIEDGRLGA